LHAQRDAYDGCAFARSVTGAFVLKKHNRRGFLSIEEQDFAAALEGNDSKGRSEGRHREHKTSQLCRQVQRALNLALAERGSDPALDQLFVDHVSPAPGCGHLLVRFVAPADRPLSDVLAGLKRETPRLRAQIARAISRKHAPELSFVAAYQPGGEDV
jgi:ribosome-binding factor A